MSWQKLPERKDDGGQIECTQAEFAAMFPDDPIAVAWLRINADDPDAMAQYNTARMFNGGLASPPIFGKQGEIATGAPNSAAVGSKPKKRSKPRGPSKLEARARILLSDAVNSGLIPDYEPEFTGAVPGRKYRLDFAWPEFRLYLEVNGGNFGGRVYCQKCKTIVKKRNKAGKWYEVRIGQGHGRGKALEKDYERLSLLTGQGWRQIAVTGEMIDSGLMMQFVIDFFENYGTFTAEADEAAGLM